MQAAGFNDYNLECHELKAPSTTWTFQSMINFTHQEPRVAVKVVDKLVDVFLLTPEKPTQF